MPLRARLALYGACVVALAVLIFGVLVYALIVIGLARQRDRTLVTRGQETATALAQVQTLDPRRLSVLAPIDLTHSSDTFVEVLSTDGQPLSSSGTINGAPPAIPGSVLERARGHGHDLATVPIGSGQQIRVYAQPWIRSDQALGGYVIAGQTARVLQSQLVGLISFLIISALLSLLAAMLANWFVSKRALQPLQTMAGLADEIGRTQDLSRRLRERPSGDEIARLSESFNHMLARLEAAQHGLRRANERLASSLEVQKRFLADASHELRTPLTTIRANAGLLLHRDDLQPEDRLAALQDIDSEGERMSNLVWDLLALARADAGFHFVRQPVDLAAIVAGVCRQARQLHPQRQIILGPGAQAFVAGDADALRQLVWILVGNALAHTPPDAVVHVDTDSTDATVVVTVADTGPGIPDSALERVFERFYQANPARSGAGAGLGLAIARWIVEEHGGRVWASNLSPHGAVFRVEFSSISQSLLIPPSSTAPTLTS